VLAFFIAAGFVGRGIVAGPQEDPSELVRKSIAQDQLDWVRMKDYTWQARSTEHHFDAHGNVESTKEETWETLILDGQPHRRMLERNGKPLSADEQKHEQEKLDRETAKLSHEAPAEKQRQSQEAEAKRKREFAFLTEIPDLFNLRLEGQGTVDGRLVWIVSGEPRPGAQPKSRDARLLLKVRGRLWIDQRTYQWVKAEAETTSTISWGLFLARLDAGSKLLFEQTEVSTDLWLPKHLFVSGSGRIALLKRVAEDQDIEWSNYKKFSVDSKIVTEGPIHH
jgi:hypothetical protein